MDECIVALNIVRAKLMARSAGLKATRTMNIRQVAEAERIDLAKDYVKAALRLIENSWERDDEVQLELPF